MQVEVRQVYHEKWGQRRKLSWIRPHRMRDSSLMSFAEARQRALKGPVDITEVLWHTAQPRE